MDSSNSGQGTPQARDTLEAARRYRALGLSVIPILRGAKTPDYRALRSTGERGWFGHVTHTPYGRRLPNDEELRAWFASARNIALVPAYGQHLVIDFDDPDSYQAWRERYATLAAGTPTQRTVRGYHVLLRLDGPRVLDSKAVFDGAVCGDVCAGERWTVVAPSSRGEPGNEVRYEWLAGLAPWETAPATIATLAEIGIEQRRTRTVLRRASHGVLAFGNARRLRRVVTKRLGQLPFGPGD